MGGWVGGGGSSVSYMSVITSSDISSCFIFKLFKPDADICEYLLCRGNLFVACH